VVSIIKVEPPFPIGQLHQLANKLLPHAPPLILQQPPMARLIRNPDVVGEILPTTPGGQDVQNAVDDFAIIGSFSPSRRCWWQ